MKIVMFGPQGSGKGTQAEYIARRYHVSYVSTGDIFRYHLKNQTALGGQVASNLNAGQLVPDELTNQIVRDRVSQPDCADGFVLDGYPRNKVQQDFLNHLTAIDFVIVINLSDEAAIARLGERLACKCGATYHLTYNPPQRPGICDSCGDALFRRDDDQPAAIAQRLQIYHQQTEPLFEAYRAQGVLYAVDGAPSIEEVSQQIAQVIQYHQQTYRRRPGSV